MSVSLKIWCNQALSEAALAKLKAGVGENTLVIADQTGNNLSAAGAAASLAEADVAFGQPDVEQTMELPSLRWIQLTSAGYSRYDREDLREALQARGAKMTNSSSVFDDPCAQHLLAFMLAQARQLPQALVDQFGPKTWNYEALRPRTRLLKDETVLIVGFGAIGKRLSELLMPFNLNLIGIRRTARSDDPIPTHDMDRLERYLPGADHVVDILPGHPSTNGMFGETQFMLMKTGAVFYNIGRGTTVNQSSLDSALRSGRLAAAYLDVTDPEPLPPDHLLWAAPNCFITPHIGGGHGDESLTLVSHFLENLKRFEAGEAMLDRIV
jgi:phosphoglycerate dehydrogenase-like enzyme